MSAQEHPTKIEYYEIACQQVLEEDYSVFSIQWVTIPDDQATGMTPEMLMRFYLAYIRYFTYPLVRPVTTGQGVEFRLFNSRVPLLKFAPPVPGETPRGKRLTLPIVGGVLVQPKQADRGELDFMVETTEEGTRLTLQLSDYHPLLLGSQQPSLWRKWLYRLTQAYIHKVVTVRFLARVHHRIAGFTPKIKTVKVTLRPGEET